MIETPMPDSVSAVHNGTNPRDGESEFERGQEGKIREIVMDNVDSDPRVSKLKIVFFFLVTMLYIPRMLSHFMWFVHTSIYVSANKFLITLPS